jgi:hypothetical protein
MTVWDRNHWQRNLHTFRAWSFGLRHPWKVSLERSPLMGDTVLNLGPIWVCIFNKKISEWAPKL